MNILLRILAILFLVIGLYIWVSEVHPIFAANAAPISFSLTPYTAGALAAYQPQLPVFDHSGVVLIYVAAGMPGVPYLAYINSKGSFETRELVFDNGRGCAVDAGEYPCTRGIGSPDIFPAGDVSPIPSGSSVHIVGSLEDQAVLVHSYTSVANVSPRIIVFHARKDEALKLSNGLVVTPHDVRDDASCTLGVGCMGNGVPRVRVTVSQGHATTVTDLVPGRIFEFKNSTISIASIDANSGQTGFTFFVATK